MALKSVTNTGGGLQIGEKAEGFLVGTPVGGTYNTAGLLLQGEDGSQRTIRGGNIKYAIQDKKVTLGQFTVVTRTPDRFSKKMGKNVANYDISQDADVTIAVDEFDAAMAAPVAAATPTIADLKARASKLSSHAKNG